MSCGQRDVRRVDAADEKPADVVLGERGETLPARGEQHAPGAERTQRGGGLR